MSHLTSPLLELLKDVGRFVAETLSGEKLSEKASARRQALVQRLSLHLPDTFPPYLDMTATQPKGMVSNEHLVDRSEYVGADKQLLEEEEYEEFPPPSTPSQPREEVTIPQISYLDLRTTSPKSGPLHRAERRFFRDVFRRYWVGISEQRMLFYEKDRDLNPSFVLDVSGFQARAAPTIVKDPKRKCSCFEIICQGKKTTQMIARTAKDMEQWVVAIGQAGRATSMPSDSPVLRRRQLPSIPDSDTSETYDDIEAMVQKQKSALVTVPTAPVVVLAGEDEEIYHDISIPSGEDSDAESIYDDVGSYPISVYYNMGKETTLPLPKPVTEVHHEPPLFQQPHSSQKDEIEEMYDDISAHNETITPPNPFKEVQSEPPLLPQSNPSKKEEEEEMYDDISAHNETLPLPKPFKEVSHEPLPLPQTDHVQEDKIEETYDDISAHNETLPQNKKPTPREYTGSRIQGLVINLEATLGRENHRFGPGFCHPKPLPNNKLSAPLDSSLPKPQSTFRPQLPTKPNLNKK